MTTGIQSILAQDCVAARDKPKSPLEPHSAFDNIRRQPQAPFARPRVFLATHYQVIPEFHLPFAIELRKFLAFAKLFAGVEEIWVSLLDGDKWVVGCYFSNPTVRRFFTASQNYRRHIRRLREFSIQA